MSESVIIRRKVASNYTVLDNAVIRDTRLSWKALGLLVRLLSLPPNFSLCLKFLAHERPSGRDATRSGLTELERSGYLTILRERDESGKFAKTTWLITDCPTDRPISENPNAANPTTANAWSGKLPQVSTDSKKVLSLETTTTKLLPNVDVRSAEVSHGQVPIIVPPELEAVLPIINHLPAGAQQDIIDEIEGKRRRGMLRSEPVGLARYFAKNPKALVLSDGLKVRRERKQALQEESFQQLEAKKRRADDEKLNVGLANMSEEEFNSVCAALPLRIRERVIQQRMKILAAAESENLSRQAPLQPERDQCR